MNDINIADCRWHPNGCPDGLVEAVTTWKENGSVGPVTRDILDRTYEGHMSHDQVTSECYRYHSGWHHENWKKYTEENPDIMPPFPTGILGEFVTADKVSIEPPHEHAWVPMGVFVLDNTPWAVFGCSCTQITYYKVWG